MKMNALQRDVTVSADLEQSEFKIKASAQMFSVLADKMYSDKPLAVIREYTCNAIDAHLMNGCTLPWIVMMPSRLEPMFVVRDFGPGMSHDDVMHRYTTFGDSSKNDDDNAIGGFGLGCKAGFAYSDAFTVTSFQDGRKRVYAAFRGPNGIPVISPISDEETDEPSGMEIRVPVKDFDFSKFTSTAQTLLRNYPEGCFTPVGFEVTPVVYSEVTPTYRVKATANNYDKPYLLMGPVAYDLDWSKVLQDGETPLPNTIVPIFAIGELDLQPSREGLSYDPRTVKLMRERYKEIAAQLAKSIYDKAVGMTIWERMKYKEQCEANKTFSYIQTTYGKDGFGGLPIEYELKGNPQCYTVYASRKESIIQERHNSNRAKPEPLSLSYSQLRHQTGIVFVIDDMHGIKDYKRRVTARFRQYVDDHTGGSARFYFFDFIKTLMNKKDEPLLDASTTDEEKLQAMRAFKPEYAEIQTGYNNKDDLADDLHGWPGIMNQIVFLSEMDLPVSDKVKLERGAVQLRVLGYRAGDRRYSYSKESYWKQLDGLNDGGIYMPMNSYTKDLPNGVKLLDSKFIANEMILGLSKKALAAIKGSANEEEFVRIDAVVEQRYQEALATPGVVEELQRRVNADAVKNLVGDVGVVVSLCGSTIGRQLFPGIAEALEPIRGHLVTSEISALADKVDDHQRRFMLKRPTHDKRLVTKVEREAKKAMKTSAILQLAVLVWKSHSENILAARKSGDDHVSQLTTTLAALAKVKLKKD